MNACITAIGAHTSLGSSTQSAAAYRCSMARAQELKAWPYFDNATKQPQLVVGHPAAGVDAGFQGLGRLLKIAKLAFEDLVHNMCGRVLPECPILWALPAANPAESFVVDLPVEFDRFLSRLELATGLPGIKHRSSAIFRGRISAALAIESALSMLDSGDAYCLVVALDSNLDSNRIENWIVDDVVKTVDQPAGPMPGEAMNLMLIESQPTHEHSPRIVAVHTEIEETSDQESTENRAFTKADGVQFSEAITQVCRKADLAAGTSGTIYADLNGTEGRAIDFGHALVRVLKECQLSSWPTQFPAVGFGDTGAAHMGLSICLAINAMARGYHHGTYSLVTGRSVYGESAAVLLKGN